MVWETGRFSPYLGNSWVIQDLAVMQRLATCKNTGGNFKPKIIKKSRILPLPRQKSNPWHLPVAFKSISLPSPYPLQPTPQKLNS